MEITRISLTKLDTLNSNLVQSGKQLNDFYLARYFLSVCVPDERDSNFSVPALAAPHIRGGVMYAWGKKHIEHLENEPVSKDGLDGARILIKTLDMVEERYTSASQPTVKKNRVRIRTVHSAKGLQWDTVFFLDADTQGKGPYGMNGFDGVGENEEVRISYVGVTRARNRLIV